MAVEGHQDLFPPRQLNARYASVKGPSPGGDAPKRPFAGRAEPGERRSITVIRRRYADRLDRQLVVARVDHGMIRPTGRSRRGPQNERDARQHISRSATDHC